MYKPKIGITIGDINGIGPEVLIKVLQDKRMLDICTPVIFSNSKVLAYHKNIVKPRNFQFKSISDLNQIEIGKINVFNAWEGNIDFSLGEANETGGQFAKISIDKAIEAYKGGFIDAIVTLPINKKAMELGQTGMVGHTEYIGHAFDSDKPLMTMVSDNVRIAMLTNHLSLEEVSKTVTGDLIKDKINTFYKSLQQDFSITKPKIAVLGLNPHAGDGGVLGKEEIEIMRPAIVALKKQNKIIHGPFSADGFFASGDYLKYDGIMAAYHDQGLIPFKILAFTGGTNFTAGLDVVRTSPVHGTAYDIVGKNIADGNSFRSAIYVAIDVVRNRKNIEIESPSVTQPKKVAESNSEN